MSLPAMATWSAMAAQAPAYNAVPARTTLVRPAPMEAPPVAAAKPKKVVWPPAVKEYVSRAIAEDNQIPGITMEDVQNQLRKTIQYFAERSMLEHTDWPNYPLPQAILMAERNAAQAYGSGVPQYMSPYESTNHHSPSTSSKRKSQDGDELPGRPAETSLPWHQKTNLQDRITFDNGNKRAKTDDTSKLNELEKRRKRFQLETTTNKTTPPWGSPRNDIDSDMPTGPVVGTNKALEKRYFRLTAPPKPETVRPQHVLEKALDMLRRKWKEGDRNYNYICNQFKSLRQDLTVQHIKNAFTVKVYEMHARIALEKGDLGEYNQCQTQLRALYMQKLGGHPSEFLAYRILYFVYTCNKTDMNDLLAELTAADKTQESVKHALEVRSALAMGNYHKFFKLYLEAPNMGAYLMDMFIERERLAALANISRAYMSVALRFLTEELGFENDDDCRAFLEGHGAQKVMEHKAHETNGSQLRVNFKGAAPLFEQLRKEAFRMVDIKGQV